MSTKTKSIKPTKIRYRRHVWYDERVRGIKYGIQANSGDGEGWLHCCEGKKPLLFENEIELIAKLKELRSQP